MGFEGRSLADQNDCKDNYINLLSNKLLLIWTVDKMGQNNILIVGLQSVGKSSIVKRIMDLSFDTKLRPTLGFQVFNFMMEKVNFRIFDAPGQEKLRDTW